MIGLNMQLDCGAKQVRHAKDSKQAVLVVGSSGTEAANTPVALSVSEGTLIHQPVLCLWR